MLSVVPMVRVRDEEAFGGYRDGGDLGLQLKFEKRNLGMPGEKMMNLKRGTVY